MEANMRAFAVVFATFATLFVVHPAGAQGRTYGGHDCTVDCSGHAAGYKWAEKKGIENEGDCPIGNSLSFHEGCVAYTEDNGRLDPGSDDQGNMAGRPITRPMDSDHDDDDKE
jgi:hypothetical protein